jgi:hypothetical protein
MINPSLKQTLFLKPKGWLLGAQYVALQKKIGVKTCLFGSTKWFLYSICAQDSEAGKRQSKALHMMLID